MNLNPFDTITGTRAEDWYPSFSSLFLPSPTNDLLNLLISSGAIPNPFGSSGATVSGAPSVPPAVSATPPIFDWFQSPSGAGAGVGVSAGPSAGPAAAAGGPSVGSSGLAGSFGSGLSNGIIGMGLDALSANPTISFANGNFGLGMNSGTPAQGLGITGLGNLGGFLGSLVGLGPLGGLVGSSLGNGSLSLSGLVSSLGSMGVPGFGLANSALGGLASLGMGSPQANGLFSGPLGGMFGGFGNGPGTMAGNTADSLTGDPSPAFTGLSPAQVATLSNLGLATPTAEVDFDGPAVPSDPTGPVGEVGNGPVGEATGSPTGDAPAGSVGVGGAPGVGDTGDSGVGDAGAAAAGDAGDGGGGGDGVGGGGGGGGGGSLLCNYALNNGVYDHETAQGHRRKFGALAERAFRSNPGLKESFSHYQQASRQIIHKIDTLSPDRRQAALSALHSHLVAPFSKAAAKGDVKGAGRILRAQTVRLAKEHNVTIPPEHLAASVKHLGAL